MSDDTPTQKFDQPGADAPTEVIGGPPAPPADGSAAATAAGDPKSRRLIIILASIGGALLLAVLILLIVSVALHLVMVGLGLFFFGAEGSRTTPFSEARWDIGGMTITGQSLVILGVTALLVVGMFFFFERTIVGKALRATAINRVGARLMGIPTALSGDLSFALAALIGAISGLLIAPVTTVYYDTGFLIGLKGFVAAIVGGLASYPLALAGALLVGQLESFASFWASAFKEVLVFTLIIPVLWWRSLHTHHVEDEE